VRLEDWAVAAWARPGVAEACLDLQDRHAQCVALLLWRLWAGSVDDDALARAIGMARPFEHEVLGPLRGARRSVGDGDLKAKIQAAELAAEQELLGRLERIAPQGWLVDAEAALAALMQAWNGAGGDTAEAAGRLAAATGFC
jgi:uncharacterized protein (TIGR02444 family)